MRDATFHTAFKSQRTTILSSIRADRTGCTSTKPVQRQPALCSKLTEKLVPRNVAPCGVSRGRRSFTVAALGDASVTLSSKVNEILDSEVNVSVDDFAADTRPVILFDGVCNLCNTAVNFMLDWDPQGNFRLAALQSTAGRRLLLRCGRSADDISSIVLVEQGGSHFTKSDAILKIAAGISNPFPFLALFGFPAPLFIRDTLYDLVADNRYDILGKRDTCRLSDPRATNRFIVE